MKALIRAKKALVGYEILEDGLAKLMEFGKPMLFCHDDLTWTCSVELNTDKINIHAKCHSGHKHPTPNSAVTACLAKLSSGNPE